MTSDESARRLRAVEHLRIARLNLTGAASAYRIAWHCQKEATEGMLSALKDLEAMGSLGVSASQKLEGLHKAIDHAHLLDMDLDDDAFLKGLHIGARQLDGAAAAVEALADALDAEEVLQ